MKRYIKGSLTSGCVGIWWIYEDTVIGRVVPLDDGYNDGQYIHYDNYRNHMTEWNSVIQEYVPDWEQLKPRGYKCLERGRVLYNIRTQCYEILCSEAVAHDVKLIEAIVEAYNLQNCRYDVFALTHYYKAEPSGNPEIDKFLYGI